MKVLVGTPYYAPSSPTFPEAHRHACSQPVLWIALLSVGACGGGAENGWTVTEQKSSGGVPHVVNIPPAEGVVPTWRVEPELRIGQVEGTDPDVFGQIKGLVVDSRGRIFVLDAAASELRIFGEDGQHLRSFGRKGAGPGEFNNANGMVIGRDDVVRVYDPANKRITKFHADSGLAGSFPISSDSYTWVWEAMLDTAQTLWYTNVIAHDSGNAEGLKGYSLDGVWMDTIRLPPSPRQADGYYQWSSGTTRGWIQVPYWPSSVQAMDPRGYLWRKGETNEYRMVRTTLTGDTVLIVESRRTPIAVTQQERDSVIAEVRKEAGNQDWSRIPPHKPIVKQLFVSDDGDVWLLTTSPDGSESVYDVFAADGRYRGTAVIAGKADLWIAPVVRADTFWGIVRDELDVAYVVRGKLHAARDQ